MPQLLGKRAFLTAVLSNLQMLGLYCLWYAWQNSPFWWHSGIWLYYFLLYPDLPEGPPSHVSALLWTLLASALLQPHYRCPLSGFNHQTSLHPVALMDRNTFDNWAQALKQEISSSYAVCTYNCEHLDNYISIVSIRLSQNLSTQGQEMWSMLTQAFYYFIFWFLQSVCCTMSFHHSDEGHKAIQPLCDYPVLVYLNDLLF